MEEDEQLRRLNKIEVAIEKLTEVAANLNKLIAVTEEKITLIKESNEYRLSQIENAMERAKEETSRKLEIAKEEAKSDIKVVYETIRFKNSIIDTRLRRIERMMWIIIGACSVIIFLFSYGGEALKILSHLVT